MGKRRSPRHNIELDVELTSHVGQAQIVKTRDISDGGMFLLMDEKQAVPTIGEVVGLMLVGDSANHDPLPENAAVVVHKDSAGIGVAYVKMELDEDF